MGLIRLTPRQRRGVRDRLGRAADAGTYRRLLALLELDRGRTAAEVADLLRVTRQTVYNRAAAFAADPDPAALRPRHGGGHPGCWTPALRAALLAALGKRPADLGYPGANWTVPLLRAYLGRAGGRDLSDDTVRRELDRLGYVWKRHRYVLPPDPEREKKTGHPPAAAGPAGPGRRPGRGRDRPPAVPPAPGRVGQAGGGGPGPDHRRERQAGPVRALNIRTGGRVLLARRSGRGPDFEDFLDLVRGHYRGRPVVLLVDEDRSHTAEDSRDTAEDLGIELVWLPKRSPHLNPMDHLWRHGKERMSGNYQYASVEAQADAVIDYLVSLSRTDALRKAGVLSKRFWLRP